MTLSAIIAEIVCDMVGIGRASIVVQMTSITGCGRASIAIVEMASDAPQPGVRAHNIEAGCLQVIEGRTSPLNLIMADGAIRRKAERGMRRVACLLIFM
jgi:hypothetical protein